MSEFFRSFRNVAGILALAGSVLTAQTSLAQAPQTVQSLRSSFSALLDGYDQVYRQEGDFRGVQSVAKAKAAMLNVQDADLARIFAKTAVPDMSSAVSAIQRLTVNSQRELLIASERQKSLPFPGTPSVISACNSTPHGDQITYDALIAFQVTSGLLSAATFVCTQDILGENASVPCIALAIANDVASSLFAVRSFCGGLDSGATAAGTYDRLGHIHDDLTNALSTIVSTSNTNTATLTNNISASTTSINNNINTSTTAINTNVTNSKNDIINNDNTNKNTVLTSIAANTTTIVNSGNSNTASIISNDNTNRDMIVSQLQALGCEIVRLLNTPDGQRASSVAACKAQPGFPYSWNKR